MVINQRFVQLQNTSMETLITYIFNLAMQEKKQNYKRTTLHYLQSTCYQSIYVISQSFGMFIADEQRFPLTIAIGWLIICFGIHSPFDNYQGVERIWSRLLYASQESWFPA